MPTVFLATLGQRPEAITVALDRQLERYSYDQIGILHTEPFHSGISKALSALREVLPRDYEHLSVRYHELLDSQQRGLIDLDSASSAQAYFEAIFEVLNAYRQEGYHIHLLVSGGRKAMSVYATLAASYLFDTPYDKVLTVLSSENLVAEEGKFHAPSGMRGQVQVVDLPLRPARLVPGANASEIIRQRPQSSREEFLGRLTPQERLLCDTLLQNPHATNRELGKILHKTERTVENQLSSIYDKMEGYFTGVPEASKKRFVLLRVLQG